MTAIPASTRIYHRRTVVDEVTDPKLEVSRKEAGSKYEPGDYLDEEVAPEELRPNRRPDGETGDRAAHS